MLRLVLALVALAVAPAPGAAQERERVDLALVLLADASGSIDPVETDLQRSGFAEAMADAEVLWAIANGGALGRIAVTYVEWASLASRDVVVPWMIVEDAASAAAFGERLMAAPRTVYGSNAIGAALLKGLELIETAPFEAARAVIDLSGDSAWNPQGPPIEAARDIVVGEGVTINGLAILCNEGCSGRPRMGDLEAEFEARLIGGLGAFVVTADGRENFRLAVRRKLIMEIAGEMPEAVARIEDAAPLAQR
jgi:hypothetical protein